MRNLKERFDSVRMSDTQKERILRNVKDMRVQPRSQNVGQLRKVGPIIASVILGVVMIFLIFTLLDEPQNVLQPESDSAASEQGGERPITKEIIIWSSFATLLMAVALYAFKKCVQTVKRWQSNEKVIFAKRYIEKWSSYIVINVVLAGLIWGGGYVLGWSLFYVQLLAAISVTAGVFLWGIYDTRDNEWCSCPHCGTPFTRKQMRQKLRWQYLEKCDACDKQIYVDSKQMTSVPIAFYCSFFGYYTIFNMNIFLVILMGISVIWLTTKYVSPYSVQFLTERQDDPKMW